MFRRIFFTAIIAGFLGGLGISVVHEFTTTPIILHLEQFEAKLAPGVHKHSNLENVESPLLILTQSKEAPAIEQSDWMPADGIERTIFTTLANILTGIGFALILVACIALSGRPVTGRTGVLWGIAGFAAINLGPALGLPPEVSGSMTADLAHRQGWWLLCTTATAAGLWMLVFRQGALWMVSGIALIALPHLIGAPPPARIGGTVPAELAGQFAATSLVTAAIFWTMLGWLSGTFWHRSEAT